MTKQQEGLAFRNPIDQLGFARVCHIVTLDKDLSDGAYRLYVLLLKYARDAEGCWPGRKRLARDLGTSVSTVDRRLSELVKRELITREQRLNRTAMTWIEDLRDVYDVDNSVPSKNDSDVPVKNGKDMSLAKVTGKQETEGETDMKGDGDPKHKQNQAFDALNGFGVSETVARRLAGERSLESVLGWIAYAKQAKGLHSPIAFVVARLQDGEEPPAIKEKRSGRDRRRYVEGKYAEFIQH